MGGACAGFVDALALGEQAEVAQPVEGGARRVHGALAQVPPRLVRVGARETAEQAGHELASRARVAQHEAAGPELHAGHRLGRGIAAEPEERSPAPAQIRVVDERTITVIETAREPADPPAVGPRRTQTPDYLYYYSYCDCYY